MRKLTIVALLSMSAVSWAGGSTLTDSKLCFSNIDRIFITPDSQESTITAGQPWGGITSDKNCFTVRAGLKQSKEVMDWLQNQLEEDGIPWSAGSMLYPHISSSFTEPPASAAFAFKLDDIEFTSYGSTIVCESMYVAQSPLPGFSYEANASELFSNNNYDNQTLQCNIKGTVSQPLLETLSYNYTDISSGLNYVSKVYLGNRDNIYDNQMWFSNASISSINVSQVFRLLDTAYLGSTTSQDKIHIISQRYNNTSVRDSVQQNMESSGIEWNESNMVGARMDGKGTPDELSFAIKLDMNISFDGQNLVCRNFYLAQGQKGSKDNWWIVMNNNLENQTLTCTNPDGQVSNLKVKNDGNSSNIFTFTN